MLSQVDVLIERVAARAGAVDLVGVMGLAVEALRGWCVTLSSLLSSLAREGAE